MESRSVITIEKQSGVRKKRDSNGGSIKNDSVMTVKKRKEVDRKVQKKRDSRVKVTEKEKEKDRKEHSKSEESEKENTGKEMETER